MLHSLKECVRTVALAVPGGAHAYRWAVRRLAEWRFRRTFPGLDPAADAATIFDRFYTDNAWGTAETASGPGSTLAYTAQIRGELPAMFEELGVRTLLDAPCGDLNWIQAVEWRSPIRYIGGDISPALIAANKARCSSPDRTFLVLDIRHDPLPAADLWLCRDCLFHLPERDIFAALANYLRHDIPYLLTSSHPGCRINTDAPTGGFRLLNLELPPYNLGQPLRVVNDWVPGFAKRNLALWSREQVTKCSMNPEPNGSVDGVALTPHNPVRDQNDAVIAGASLRGTTRCNVASL